MIYSHISNHIDLKPFLKFSTFKENENNVIIEFNCKMPNIVIEKLNSIKSGIEKECLSIANVKIDLNFNFNNFKPVKAENDIIGNEPLVQEVLKTFDGEIVKILRGDKNG